MGAGRFGLFAKTPGRRVGDVEKLAPGELLAQFSERSFFSGAEASRVSKALAGRMRFRLISTAAASAA